ncbi:TIGR04104 family putative zinc finger protein [Peribacillus sp. NPDC096379]|uniref:TIGR04104 family putative zinc finger protein n=1 Tax=Peribacillus sp. NPDC096379 TaxID=3364393 RepID=UPI0037F8ACFC
MQKCENCNSQFSWSKIFKSFFWWTYKPIECDNCGSEHKITILGISTVAVISILPIWIFGFFLPRFDNIFVMPGIGVLIGFIGFFCTPYVVRYKKVL